MITFCGFDLTPPHDAQAITDGWWHGHRVDEYRQPWCGHGMDHLPLPAMPALGGRPRVGVLHWPTGASRWATCHLLATGPQLASLRTLCGGVTGFVPTPRVLKFEDGKNPPVETSMWLQAVRPISQRGDGKELYLLTLVDERYWWWQYGSAFSSGAPGYATSWAGGAGLITGLFAQIPYTGTLAVDAVPAGYGTPYTPRWDVLYKPIPPIIDAACQTVGLRVVRSLDGNVRCQSYATAAAADEANWNLYRYEVMTGGRLAAGDICRGLPAEVVVVYPDPYSPDTTSVALSSLGLAEFAGLTGAGWQGQVVADLPASADPAGRAAYATQAATDYYRWSLSVTDCTLRGLVARPVTGLDDCQEWVHTPDLVCTRVIRPPFADRTIYGGRPHPRFDFPFRISTTVAPGSTAWSDGSTDLVIQNPGRYLITCSGTAVVEGSGYTTLGVRLYDATNAVAVPGTALTGGYEGNSRFPFTLSAPYETLLPNVTIRLQAARGAAGTYITTVASSSEGFWYVRLY